MGSQPKWRSEPTKGKSLNGEEKIKHEFIKCNQEKIARVGQYINTYMSHEYRIVQVC